MGVVLQPICAFLIYLGWGNFTSIISPWASILVGAFLWIALRWGISWLFPKSAEPEWDPFLSVFSVLYAILAIVLVLAILGLLGASKVDRLEIVPAIVIFLLPGAIINLTGTRGQV